MRAAGAPTARRGLPGAVGAAVLVGLLVGAFTAYGQGWLGDSFGSLVNSAGPWSVAAFLVARGARTPWAGALAAAITLALCEVGYVVANNIRDVPSSSSTVAFWVTAAVLAGPPLGVAAVWSRLGRPVRAAAGYGVVAGVLVGEGAYGLARLTDTTSSGYWVAEIVVGMAGVIALVVVPSVRGRDWRALGAGLAVATASATTVFVAAISF